MVQRAVRLPFATPLELPALPEDLADDLDAAEAEQEADNAAAARAAADRRPSVGGAARSKPTSGAGAAVPGTLKPIPFPRPAGLRPAAAANKVEAAAQPSPADGRNAGDTRWPAEPNEAIAQASSRLRSQLDALRAERKPASAQPAVARSVAAPTLERRAPESTPPDWLIRDVDGPAADARRRRLHPIVIGIGALLFAGGGAGVASLFKGAFDGHAVTTASAVAPVTSATSTPAAGTKAILYPTPAATPTRVATAVALDAKPRAAGTDDPGIAAGNPQIVNTAGAAPANGSRVSRTIETAPRVVATVQPPQAAAPATISNPAPLTATTQPAPSTRSAAAVATADPPRSSIDDTPAAKAPSLVARGSTSTKGPVRPAAPPKQRSLRTAPAATVAAAPKTTDVAADPAPEGNGGLISNFMSFVRGSPSAQSGAAVASSDVNVHAAPGSKSASIGVLKAGTSVPAAADCKGWCQVTVNGKTGWVYHTFLK